MLVIVCIRADERRVYDAAAVVVVVSMAGSSLSSPASLSVTSSTASDSSLETADTVALAVML